jgi:hypothetical protein
MELRKKICWMDFPAVQLRFRLLAHRHFEPCPPLLSWFRRSFLRLGDTLANEKSNKIGRRAETRDQDPNTVSSETVFHQMRRSEGNPLTGRGLQQITVPAIAWDSAPRPEQSWEERVKPAKQRLKEWNVDNVLKKGKKPYASPSVQNRRNSLGALETLLFALAQGGPINVCNYWQSCCLAPQMLIHSISGNAYFFVVAAAQTGACVWPAVFLSEEGADPPALGLSVRVEWQWFLTIFYLLMGCTSVHRMEQQEPEEGI